MEGLGGRRADKRGDLATAFEAVQHFREREIGKAIAVIREKVFLALEEMPHFCQTLANACVEAGVHERDVPVLCVAGN
jgi:hypothetical protein